MISKNLKNFIALSVLAWLSSTANSMDTEAKSIETIDFRWSSGDYDQEIREITQYSFDKKGWKEIPSGHQPRASKDQFLLWQSFPIQTSGFKSPALFVENIDQDFEAYVDGKLIYKNGNIDDQGQGNFLGWAWHIIELPKNNDSGRIYFRIYSNHDNIGITGQPIISEKANFYSSMLESDLARIFIIALQLIIGAFVLIIYFAVYQDKLLLYASTFVTSLSLYFLSRTQSIQIVISNSEVRTLLELFSLYFFPAGLTLLIGNQLSSKWKQVFKFIAWIFIVQSCASLALFATIQIHPRHFLLTFQITLISSLIGYIIATAYLAVTKTDLEIRIFVAGMTLASIGGVIDVLLAMNIISYTFPVSAGSFGMLLMNLGALNLASMRIRKDVSRKIELEYNDRNRKIEEYKSQMSALKTMAGGVAHEVNNPLFIIQGCASIIQKIIPPTNNKNRIANSSAEKIHRNVDRIARITENLLILANQNRQMYNKQVSVDDLLSFSILRFRNEIVDNKIEIQIDQENLSHQIKCDTESMVKAICALIDNSIDAVKSTETPWIRIEVKHIKDRIEILFIDSGPGIPQNIQKDIMVPFFSTKNVYKNSEGVGLGLGVAQGIIEQCNGTLNYDPTGANTTFIVSIPLPTNSDMTEHSEKTA